ncbi:uncharacterized protein [Periplaneta americana]|uniref:uncharacterized protein n=1 Tax=Periplaneta americana TaxID=6978 RepID=UPI0037E7271C
MRIFVSTVFLFVVSQFLVDLGNTSPQYETNDSNIDDRTLLKLKRRKIRKLCSLLGLARDNQLDPQERTLVFLQVQQIQGSTYPAGPHGTSPQAAADSLGCHNSGGSGGGGLLGSHFGGGGLLGNPLGGGGLLGPLVGGILPQSDVNPPSLADPERYLRSVYRAFRPLIRLFKK